MADNRFSKSLVLSLLIGLLGQALAQTAWVVPETAEVNQYGSWTVFYRVGDREIKPGGRIKIQFPNCWHTSPWPEGKLKQEQSTDASADHYLSVNVNGRKSKYLIEVLREGVDSQMDRFGRSFCVTLKENGLVPGDTLALNFSSTSAPTIVETQKIAIAIDHNGRGDYHPISNYPTITIKSAIAVRMRLIAPSQAITGEATNLRLVVLDNWENPSEKYFGDIRIRSTDTLINAPEKIRFDKNNNGILIFPVTFNSTGIHRVSVSGNQNLIPHKLQSNPIRVMDRQATPQVFWGDLHSHSNFSKDGYGNPETAYRYARDVSGLDFYAMTDHGAGDPLSEQRWSPGLTEKEWRINQSLINDFNEPGNFVTLLAFEWSAWSPYGHHNVYYRENRGRPFGEDSYPDITDIIHFLKAGGAFMVPHHTGLAWWNGVGHNTNWNCAIHNDIRPAIEIYSLWGSSEYYGNEMPYENYHQRDLISQPEPNYARDAWQYGHYIGVIGGSDNHNSKPGMDYGGLTAVLCESLTREKVFDAILKRHTYATTGERILLEFSINNQQMGSRFKIDSGSPVTIKINAHGTDRIAWLELIQYDGSQWSILEHLEPNKEYVIYDYQIDQPHQDCLFYIRLQQHNIIGNRYVMAWSSPIWIAVSDTPWWNEDSDRKRLEE